MKISENCASQDMNIKSGTIVDSAFYYFQIIIIPRPLL